VTRGKEMVTEWVTLNNAEPLATYGLPPAGATLQLLLRTTWGAWGKGEDAVRGSEPKLQVCARPTTREDDAATMW
jgi:hypothetical protein